MAAYLVMKMVQMMAAYLERKMAAYSEQRMADMWVYLKVALGP